MLQRWCLFLVRTGVPLKVHILADLLISTFVMYIKLYSAQRISVSSNRHKNKSMLTYEVTTNDEKGA